MLFIDTTKTVPFELDGTVFQLRVLTARQRLKLMRAANVIHDMVKDFGDDDRLPPGIGVDILERQFDIMQDGVESWDGCDSPNSDDFDTIPAEHWPTIVSEIIKANELSRADAEN